MSHVPTILLSEKKKDIQDQFDNRATYRNRYILKNASIKGPTKQKYLWPTKTLIRSWSAFVKIIIIIIYWILVIFTSLFNMAEKSIELFEQQSDKIIVICVRLIIETTPNSLHSVFMVIHSQTQQ